MNERFSGYIRATIVAVLFVVTYVTALPAAEIRLDIRAARWEIRPGLATTAWTYNGQVPGTPIIVQKGERVTVDVVNHLTVPTNIHWHGLEVPNDQDGPAIEIKPGASFHYEFTPRETGTYWYHTHLRPVLPQLDRGLYGAFIVSATEDASYSGDHTFILDDWYLDANGRRLEGTAQGSMERYGNVETVNGKTAAAVEPLSFKSGELHKVRFINASTAAVHTLRASGHLFRVTHTDGHPLPEPYLTEVIVLQPAERIDAEIAAVAAPGSTWSISSDRPELGIRIPIKYGQGTVERVASPYRPPQTTAFPGIVERVPDAVLVLNSRMGMMSGGMGGMMSMGQGSSAMMEWTINGSTYPETEPLFVKTGEVVKVRIRNDDTAMMHPMDHPIHIHGTYFQVVALNGSAPPRETWKDTVNVPAGQFVDIAFVMRFPGQWMLHCHIIDHEDGGMVMMIEVR